MTHPAVLHPETVDKFSGPASSIAFKQPTWQMAVILEGFEAAQKDDSECPYADDGRGDPERAKRCYFWALGQTLSASDLDDLLAEEEPPVIAGRVGEANWTRYTGPRGGRGWQSTQTGRVVYQEQMPGEDEHDKGESPVKEWATHRFADPAHAANFVEWFGESQAVDDNGVPLTLYHGSPEAFDQFDTGMNLGEDRDRAAFFSDSPEVASGYAKHQSLADKKSMKKLYDAQDARDKLGYKLFDHSMPERPNTRLNMLNAMLHSGEISREDYDRFNDLEDEVYDLEHEYYEPTETTPSVYPVHLKLERPLVIDAHNLPWDAVVPSALNRVDREKHDGIIWRNIKDNPGTEEFPSTTFAIFSPQQAKSATGNSGSFNQTSAKLSESWVQYVGSRGGRGWTAFQMPKSGSANPFTLAVDVDGTLLGYDGWQGEDHFGEPLPDAVEVMQEVRAAGLRIIIWTTRGNQGLIAATLDHYGIPYDFINENPDQPEDSSDKIICDEWWDDRAAGWPGIRQAWDDLKGRLDGQDHKNSSDSTNSLVLSSLFGPDRQILPQVKERLLQLGEDFLATTEIPAAAVRDVVVTGSMAGYNYVPESDVDLHLLVDLGQVGDCCPADLLADYLRDESGAWNSKHSITIDGHEVEVFLESEPAAGPRYSLVTDSWLVEPTESPEIDSECVRWKTDKLRARIDAAVSTGDADTMAATLARIRKFRRQGIAEHGPGSVEDAVYKELRRDGDLERLKQARLAAYDESMSLAGEVQGDPEFATFGDLSGATQVETPEGEPALYKPQAGDVIEWQGITIRVQYGPGDERDGRPMATGYGEIESLE